MRMQEGGRSEDFCSNEGGSAGTSLEPGAAFIRGAAGHFGKG